VLHLFALTGLNCCRRIKPFEFWHRCELLLKRSSHSAWNLLITGVLKYDSVSLVSYYFVSQHDAARDGGFVCKTSLHTFHSVLYNGRVAWNILNQASDVQNCLFVACVSLLTCFTDVCRINDAGGVQCSRNQENFSDLLTRMI
jgi:hypothetical protein